MVASPQRPGLPHVGHLGIQPWSVRPDYSTYKSPHGPKYTISTHYHGINASRALRFGTLAAGFGTCAGIFALFFFAEVPKVSKDIMQKVPVLGDYFRKEVAPEDNPF
ncbi:hypothetical protein NA57DRAFT_81829 [Rhizodiscina lignyota]|uniref:Ubiquinol-cytochrome-c reductase complex subunit-domain-containing protein n=1 Tax=Rhizodiscina lignyota TaxID=1504668 RepID=A0A9P4I3N2_9PEZI|nr:hypothetical protein NA57DRAFT_81829 [Rhizodiscina lignyota]